MIIDRRRKTGLVERIRLSNVDGDLNLSDWSCGGESDGLEKEVSRVSTRSGLMIK